VYKWDDTSALVQTVDFFTPVVDDPATFGAIAAANALSDVYAMGGRPLTALAVAGFPKNDVDEATIREIFLGGLHKLREAGVALLGGHTVQDKEIKFGYAVTGVVAPDAIWTNAGARAGDVLFLTKPLGTGVIATAIKFARASPEATAAAIEVMLELNRAAAEALATLPAGSVHGLRVPRARQRDGRGQRRHARCRCPGGAAHPRRDRAGLEPVGGDDDQRATLRSGRGGARHDRPGHRGVAVRSADVGRSAGRRGPVGGRAGGRSPERGRRRRREGWNRGGEDGRSHPASAFLPPVLHGIN
jgi:hypothetical protein